MKPTKLTICGINSYVSPQTIDFNKLSEGNLFGIFGQTGSGKSTILDAIVLALYGTSERDNLTNIINVNLKDAFVEFEFELDRNEIKKYKVLRTFKIRPSGFKSTAELINLTDNINMGDSTDKVNESIVNLIGVGKREFLKCIALPQNEFDKFIMDTPSDRKKSIAKLFDLEQFGDELNKKLKARLDVLSSKKLTLQEQISAFSFVNDSSQSELKNSIIENEKLLKEQLFVLEGLKTQYNHKKQLFDKNYELNDKKQSLYDININSSYYIKLQSELDYFKNNESNLEKFEIKKKKIYLLDSINSSLKINEQEIKTQEEKLIKFKNSIKEITDKLELEKISYNNFIIDIEKFKLIKNEIHETSDVLINLKNSYDFNLGELMSNAEQEKQFVKLIEQSENSVNKITTEFNSNNEILEKINQVMLLNVGKDFVDKLTSLKGCINQTNLDEVENYRVYRDIAKLVTKINKSILEYNIKLSERDELLKFLKIEISDIKSFRKTFEDKTNLLKIKLDKEIVHFHELNNVLNKIKTEEEHFTKIIKELSQTIIETENKLSDFKNIENNFKNLNDNSGTISKLEKELSENNTVIVLSSDKLSKLNADKKALNVEMQYLTNEINEITNSLPKNFSIIENDGFITKENFLIMEQKLNDFITKKHYLETVIENLQNEINGEIITSEQVELCVNKISLCETTINALKVQIAVANSSLKTNDEILIKNKQFENELLSVNNELNVALKLQSALSKNALVDFVSEEYLYLITEYSNKFVYKISRGKYMLSFNGETGEFMAIDNFNAGIVRSIKTLSGGERFIFSLCLALGVSQSISINNNKSFNFFFIDEGFGNLSDDYIDDVLLCFDMLIKLDFTVGFITHVEKMQEYITNKLVVTKTNNDVGTVIKQYN